MNQPRLVIRPCELRDANEFVAKLHRHHDPVVGHRFSLAVFDGDRKCGVAIVGRPVARKIDHATTVEVTRCCTDGTPNACSALYGAAARIAKEMGYLRIQTYILAEEPGTSLKATGWKLDGETSGGEWFRSNEPVGLFGTNRKNSHPIGRKTRWCKEFPK